MIRRLAGPLFFLIGVALLVWTVRAIGVAELIRALSFLQGPGLLVLFFYPLSSIWDAWGWLYTFRSEDRKKVGVMDLFWVRLAGEAMNNLTPLADWGGEPLKARLLKTQYGVTPGGAASGVILAKSVLFYSEVLYWAVGLAPALASSALEERWKITFTAVFLVCALISIALAVYQKRGFFGAMGRYAAKFFPKVGETGQTLEGVDARMSEFYSAKIFLPSFFLHFIGWIAGGVETWLILHFMGTGAGIGEAMAVEALLQLARTATFFIPASIGVQEAGMAIVFAAFGRLPSHGVAMSLVKRVRQLLWSALGLAAWAVYEWKGPRRGQ